MDHGRDVTVSFGVRGHASTVACFQPAGFCAAVRKVACVFLSEVKARHDGSRKGRSFKGFQSGVARVSAADGLWWPKVLGARVLETYPSLIGGLMALRGLDTKKALGVRGSDVRAQNSETLSACGDLQTPAGGCTIQCEE